MLNQNSKYLIILAGPTAVGKTAVAIHLAKYYNTEIISADSRQIYHELNIGVARPSEEELKEVPHHFIANKSIMNDFTAGDYKREVMELLDELYRKHDVVMLSGGTGFYINALLYGFDDIPSVDASVREALNQRFKTEGLVPLQLQLKELDEMTYASIDIHNTQRVIRALEICLGTGKPFSSFKKQENRTSPLEASGITPVKIGLNISKEQLQHNINARVDAMIKSGLLDEVKAVLPFRNHNALQTVGYKELFDCLDGKITMEEAVELIKLHTRQYAKRQLTFFNKQGDYKWFQPKEIKQLIQFIDEVIK